MKRMSLWVVLAGLFLCGTGLAEWTCLKCRISNPDIANFCGQCGTKGAWACPKCKRSSPLANKYCANCGQERPKPPAAPAEKPPPPEEKPPPPPAGQPESRPASRPATQPTSRPVPQPETPPARIPFRPRRRQRPLDEQVEEAIAKAVKFLWSQRGANGQWAPFSQDVIITSDPTRKGYTHPRAEDKIIRGYHVYPAGPTALVAYALLEAGVSPRDKRMAKTLDWLAGQKMTKTYSLAMRANAWLAANRMSKGKYIVQLRRDTKLLYNGSTEGWYTYDVSGSQERQPPRFDNSNSQFGVLGVWAGARGGAEVPPQYWQLVLQHWRAQQAANGGWAYRRPDASRTGGVTPSMTAAGLATLFVCSDNLFASRYITCRGGQESELLSINKGLEWFDKNFAETLKARRQPAWFYYYLYCMERVGLASGHKYFGTTDWYKAGVAAALPRQRPEGHWPGGITDTALALLFLVRGRHPVLFNKLQFTGDWNNRPRDLASLTRWIGKSFERTVNWQIVNFKTPVSEWHDAPILYISGAKAPQFSEDDLAKLRRYVWQGGTIFGVTECNGSAFKREIRKVYKKLFPAYELVPLGRSHGVYSAHYPLPGVPRLYAISNGVRPLVFHTDVDLPKSWQLQTTSTQKSAFQAPANIFMYVTDQGKLRFRGTTHWPDEPAGRTVRTVRLARLAHGGNCNPEPLAYTCLRRRLMAATGVRLDVVGPIEIAALGEARASVATMTGTGEFNLTDAEKKALKQFVEAGGTLVLDAAGGAKMEPDPKTKINRPVGFAASAEQLITDLFGAKALRLLSSQAPVLLLDGLEIGRVAYRRRTRARMPGVRVPNLRVVAVGDRPAVIYSPEDITAGLIGYASSEVDGYQPDSAYRLMRNIILAAPRLSPPVPSSSTRPESGGAMPADGKTLRPSDGGLFVDR